eukprot:SAG31_NODE_30567_length_379_cov_0.839286_1_plen_51_part_10
MDYFKLGLHEYPDMGFEYCTTGSTAPDLNLAGGTLRVSSIAIIIIRPGGCV